MERYEDLREQVLGGDGPHGPGMAVVRRQGLWAWMMLVAGEEADGAPPPRAPSAPGPARLPATVCGELLAAWTDLVVGTARRLEMR